jgi:competence protein ComEA
MANEGSLPVGPVNVNTSSAEELATTVSGIGPVLAERIVAHRDEHGPFATVSDLSAVRGISLGLLEKIGPRLAVRDVPLPAPSIDTEMVYDEWDAQSAPAPRFYDAEPAALVSDDELELWSTGLDRNDAGADTSTAAAEDEPAPELAPVSEYEAADQLGGAQEYVLTETETAPIGPTPAFDAVAQALADATVPSAPTATAAATAMPATPTAEPASSRRNGWRDALLVLLGGLLGVVLTLMVAIIWSGTVDFAPRSQVEAISRNVNTMQANHELAWERITHLNQRADESDRRVRAMESALATAQADMATMQSDVARMSEGLQAVRSDVSRLTQRVNATEDSLAALDASMAELQDAFAVVESKVGAFDAFFTTLRDLLIDMQGMPAAPVTATEAPARATAIPADAAAEDAQDADEIDAEEPVVTPTPAGRSS